MSLDSIASVIITQATASVSQAGFGVPLIAGYHTKFADVVRTYDASGGLTDLASDGFNSKHPIYKCAQALLAQNPKISQFKVGKLTELDKQTMKIVPIAHNSKAYLITIGAEDFTFTSDGSGTVAEICTGLTTAINASSQAFTATDSTTYVSVAADNAEEMFVYSGYDSDDLRLTDITGTNSVLAADLDAIELADPQWYCLLLANQPEADIEAAAAWVETKIKLMLADSADYGCIDGSSTTDLAHDLEASGYARTALMYHLNSGEFAGAAWAGKLLPLDPGSETWAFKSLAGITVNALNATEIANLDAKTCNHYTELAGVSITRKGYSASGEFIDITRFIDWLRARIQERVYSLFVNSVKIPYTDLGVALVKAEVLAQLREGVNIGGLSADPAPTVSAPRVSEVSSLDKAARLLPDVTFTATLAGAIHSVEITGTISV